MLPVELSTVGIAKNATFAVKSTVPWKPYVNGDRTSFVENATYNPAEFTPLVLHFINEFGPPKKRKRSFDVPSTNKEKRILTCADKRRSPCTPNPMLCRCPLQYLGSTPKENKSVPLRCTSGPKNSKKDMLLISHVRFFLSTPSKMDWSALRRASCWP